MDSITINLKKIENWILVIGAVLCGTILTKDAFDFALTSRHIIWCGFVMLLLACLFIRKPDISFSSIPVMLIILLLFECLSGFQAVNKSEWLYVILKTSLMAISVFVFVPIDKKHLIRALVILGAVYFCIAQYEFLSTPYVDSKGIFCNRNPWAIAHFLIIPFCFMEKKWKWFARVVAIGLIVNLFLLMTRSALLGFAVFLAAVLVLDKRFRKYIFGSIGIFVFVIICLRMDRFVNLESLGQRKEIWTATLQMISDNPYGIGAGNWWLAIFPYLKDVNLPNAFTSGIFRHPHNDFLWVFAESGFFGILAFLGLFGFAIRRALKSNIFLAAGLLGCMAIMCFTSFLRERAFLSLILCIMLSMTMENNGISFKSSRSFFVVCLIILSVFMIDLYYRHRALCFQTQLFKSNKWETALENGGFSVFSTLSFDGIPWYWYLGTAKMMQNQDAFEEFKTAYKYSPSNIHVLNDLGVSYAIREDLVNAEKYFSEALKINPNFNNAKINLGIMENLNGFKD